MKKLFISLLAVLPMLAYSQASPQHEQYVKIGSENVLWGDAYAAWSPGKTFYQGLDAEAEENENFNISRVKPRQRFINSNTQVRPDQDPDRKLLWWCPIGGDGWNALPSYYFGGEVWTMWNYTDIWGNWTAPLMSMPAAMLDVCHKNGVQISCLAPVPFAASIYTTDTEGYGHLMNKIISDEGGAHKFLKFLKYYGIDGLGFNSEFSWRGNVSKGNYSGYAFHTAMKKFLGDCYVNSSTYGVPFHNCWYSLTNNDGTMGGSSALNANNKDWFDYEGKPTSTAYFTNYYATPSASQTTVENNFPNRSTYDVYMGVDYQAGYSLQTWYNLKNSRISLGLWGAHNRNMLYEQRGENGSSPIAMQETYQQLLENVFTGSTRNPVNPPPISEKTKFSSKEEGAYGWAQYIVAKSTLTPQDGGNLSTDPFVTYFNLGNGMFFNVKGERHSNTEWYNLGMQDYMPSWRWWFTKTYMGRTQEEVSSDLNALFTWDDAYMGGSCLQISGATEQTYLQLFKTKYPTSKSGDYLTITYKILSGDGSLSWACSKEGLETTVVEKTISSTKEDENGWITVNTQIGGRSGIKLEESTIAQIGLKFTNTTDDFKILIGQIALTDGLPGSAITPSKPEVEKVRMLARTYKGVDLKIIFNMNDAFEGEKEAYEPIYNADVDTWYFKIYTQQEGEDEKVFTATTSWAAYTVGAPYDDIKGGKMRIGVSAVSKDGVNESGISWGEWIDPLTVEPTIIEGTEIDKPIIKVNETFTLKYIDTNHPAATWEVINSLTGQSVKIFNNTTSITMSLPTVGSYDVKITNPDNSVAYTRGIIQVSPESTGAIPTLSDLTVSDTEVYPQDKITMSCSTIRLGEGTVSRAVKVEDPYMLRFPEVVPSRPYTYMMWFKADNIIHGSQGINLIDKRNLNITWPHNNWGDLWVTIRPEMMANYEISGTTNSDRVHPANEISFNTYGWTEHDVPNSNMMSNDHSVKEGQWTHVAVTFEVDGKQKMYFNGKKVAETTTNKITSNGVSNAGCPVYVGGTSVYKSGFNGWVDEFQVWDRVLTDTEIQTAMKGYATAPSGLQGYWTFENTITDATGLKVFPNLGQKGSSYTAAYVLMEEDGNNQVEKIIDGQNGELGNPMINGSLQVKTTKEWNLPSAVVEQSTSDNATISYNAVGTYTAGLTLKNMWGSDIKSVEIAVIDWPYGVEDAVIEEMGVYPNPFTDFINMSFAKEGLYTIEIVALDGKLIESKQVNVTTNECVRVDINGEKGIYIVKVKNINGTAVRTMKLIKK